MIFLFFFFLFSCNGFLNLLTLPDHLINYFIFVTGFFFPPIFQVAATHSNCIIKKEQETCLEKIRRATALNPLNDSSPGESQTLHLELTIGSDFHHFLGRLEGFSEVSWWEEHQCCWTSLGKLKPKIQSVGVNKSHSWLSSEVRNLFLYLRL